MVTSLIARGALAATGLLHAGFAYLETVLWETEAGLGIFGNTPEDAALMAPLAFNQGVYNLFLAAGLLWAAATAQRLLGVFFALCVVVAGVVGGLTVSERIFVVQALPGAIALALSFRLPRP